MPLFIILIPGLVGGIVLAWILTSRRFGPPARGDARPLAPPSPMLINMARIRVEGFGGLGMVAVAVTVAIVEPRIRAATALAALGGLALAAVLIARRRGSGALPWRTGGPGAHLLLPLGLPREARGEAERNLPTDTVSDSEDASGGRVMSGGGVMCPRVV